MAKKKTRVTRSRPLPSNRERTAFPVLLVLVMAVIVLGMFQYSALLVAGSAIFVGFFGWLWWKRHGLSASPTAKRTRARAKRKTRAR